MALSDNAKKVVKVAMANDPDGQEILDRIDRASADVADLSASAASGTDAALIDALNAKVDELLAALRAAGLME